MNEDPSENFAPLLQLDLQMHGSGRPRPPRPTAIGQREPDSEQLHSWPVPDLRYLQRVRANNLPEQTDRRSDAMQSTKAVENLFIALHIQKANISFLLLGGSTSTCYNIGVSLPRSVQSDSSTYSRIQSLLKNSFNCENDFDVLEQDQESIKSLIRPMTKHCGLVGNIRSRTAGDAHSLAERLAAELPGKKFGLLVLAIPIPVAKVEREERIVADLIERAEDSAPTSKLNNSFVQESAEYLKRIQLGMSIGMWLTGIYYFARSREVLSLVESTLEQEGIDKLRLEQPRGLPPHINNLGLLRNKRSDVVFQELVEYKFLTPLNSQDLSDWVDLRFL